MGRQIKSNLIFIFSSEDKKHSDRLLSNHGTLAAKIQLPLVITNNPKMLFIKLLIKQVISYHMIKLKQVWLCLLNLSTVMSENENSDFRLFKF